MRTVISILEEAVATQDWDLVSEAMRMLGYPPVFTEENLTIIDPPKEVFDYVPSHVPPSNKFVEEDFRVTKAAPKVEIRAVGENLFDPKAFAVMEDDSDLYNKVNDQVQRSPRTRPPAVAEVDVFCEDCQKNIKIHPNFKRTPFNCEYKKLGQKCPRSVK